MKSESVSQRLFSTPGSYVLATVSRHMLDVTNEGAGLVKAGSCGAVWTVESDGISGGTEYGCSENDCCVWREGMV